MPEKIFDFHVHIGKFEEVYYNSHIIIKVLSSCGIKGAYISSTTSCLKWNTPNEKKIITEHIQAEFQEVKFTAERLKFDAMALCWVIPERYFE